MPSTTGSTREPIQGGQPDRTEAAVVAIVHRPVLCSGVLLAPNVVLTARHCTAAQTVEKPDCAQPMAIPTIAPDEMFVTTHNPNDANSGQYYQVRDIYVAPGPTGTCGQDVAALVLASNIPSSEAEPLEPRFDAPPSQGEDYTAIGYGSPCPEPTGCTGGSAGTRRRRDARQILCVGHSCDVQGVGDREWLGDFGACPGDSGSPALDAQGRVIGTASRGGEVDGQCGPAVYGRVDAWRNFIVTTIAHGADIGHYSMPLWATLDSGAMPDTGGPIDPSGGCTISNGRVEPHARAIACVAIALVAGLRRRGRRKRASR